MWKEEGGSGGRRRGRSGERGRNRLGSARSQVSRAWNWWAREDSMERDVGLVLVQVRRATLAHSTQPQCKCQTYLINVTSLYK